MAKEHFPLVECFVTSISLFCSYFHINVGFVEMKMLHGFFKAFKNPLSKGSFCDSVELLARTRPHIRKTLHITSYKHRNCCSWGAYSGLAEWPSVSGLTQMVTSALFLVFALFGSPVLTILCPGLLGFLWLWIIC